MSELREATESERKSGLARGVRTSDTAATRADLVVPYERRLDLDPRWALSEGSRHFEEQSAVFQALRKITRRLDDLGVPYVVVGGMALFRHGFRRFTEDVDILVSRENLRLIHEKLEGLGYLPAHRHSKHLRDTEHGVRIEFLTTGDYPGDGLPKPIAFPDPAEVGFEAEGIRYVELPRLIELKLASGMTGMGRLKDLTDVLELIKILNLPADFAENLHPYVREKYQELWEQAQKRYVLIRRGVAAGALPEMAAILPSEAEQFLAMERDGVILEPLDGAVRLVTTDPEVARKYDMVDEAEYWSADEADEA